MFPQSIENLDLEPLIVKAMDAEEGLGWTLDHAMRISAEYKNI